MTTLRVPTAGSTSPPVTPAAARSIAPARKVIPMLQAGRRRSYLPLCKDAVVSSSPRVARTLPWGRL